MNDLIYVNDILKVLNKDKKKEVVTFRCNPIVLDYLKEIAEDNKISLSSLIDNIVTEWWCNL